MEGKDVRLTGSQGTLLAQYRVDEAGYPEVALSPLSSREPLVLAWLDADGVERALRLPGCARVTLGNPNGQVLWENEEPISLDAVQAPLTRR